MLFNSYEFLFVFLPVTLAMFFLLANLGNRSLPIAWLVVASLFFYGWWNPAFLGLIAFSATFNYLLGLGLTQARSNGDGRHVSGLLAFGIVVNLGLIGYFKYAGFLTVAADRAFGTAYHLDDIVLPLAISFFTFQQIAYLVDVRRGVTTERNFLHYCLFVVFFPQLIAGPIVHHKEILPQFTQSGAFRLRATNLAIGLTIFAIGLFKKVVIADRLASTGTPVFAAAEIGATLDFFQAWTGAFAYSLQIYFDFSGYSDMAIGLARLFGIKLPLNFAAPYRATSIIDFWRRWHMTLSRFLRDYLYIPLGGSRQGVARRYINVMVTMLLGGLWHGANWTFVVWGGVHGLMLVVNIAWRAIFPWHIDQWWSRALARAATLLAVTLAWVLFRAESFSGATNMFAGMMNLPKGLSGRIGPLQDLMMDIGFRFQGGRLLTDSNIENTMWLVFWIAFLWAMPTTQELMTRFRPAFGYPGRMATRRDTPALLQRILPRLFWRPSPVWAGFTASIAILALLHLNRVSEFLYFQF
ncbi:MAG: MBOAT family O-acyltransferase [Alphaproteobacteria bacterium]